MIWGIAPLVMILATIFFDEETSLWILLGIIVVMGIGVQLSNKEE